MAHFDALIVGAGLSGIAAAHYVQTACPWASYAVFEARDAIGGTWDLFRYPGIRSDSDMHTLGYSFRPWAARDSIAAGADICAYVRETAAAEGIDRHIRFGHRVVSASWSSEEARWHVRAERTDTGAVVEVTCGFYLACSGYYRYDQGHEPEFPGRDRFAGTVVHPQHWPDGLDVTGQRVVVIGSGATAVTLVPALAATAGHVTMLQRSPTYIISAPARSPVSRLLGTVLPGRTGADATRWLYALGTQGLYEASQRRPELVKRVLRRGLERQLPPGYDIATHFTPSYQPWDQRLCLVPDGDLFRAIREGRASVVTDHVGSFTETGIRLASGATLDADVIVTATGLEMLFIGGVSLSVDGQPVDVGDRLTYKGMMLEGVPNFAVAFGYTNASWTLKAELTCDYVSRLMNHLRATGLRQCTPVNDDLSLPRQPFLSLSSGYVQRKAHEFPKQGDRFPWQVHQSYWRDHRIMTRPDLEDDVMVFSNPAPGATAGPAVPAGRFEGRVAAITGAASGIGRALAVELARRGAHLALADVDETGLAETVARCEGAGVKVTAARVDVADRAAVEAWADEVVAQHGRVNLVVNNAGVALAATVANLRSQDLDWLMGINFWGVVHGTQAFLPHLEASGEGHVVNLSSVFGLLSIPTQSAYNAAKFAVRGFTDALRMELEIDGSCVSATTVHPGGVRTNIARNARIGEEEHARFVDDDTDAGSAFDRIARTTPEEAARAILAGVEQNRRRVLIGADAKVIAVLAALPPGVYQRALVAGARAMARRRPSPSLPSVISPDEPIADPAPPVLDSATAGLLDGRS